MPNNAAIQQELEAARKSYPSSSANQAAITKQIQAVNPTYTAPSSSPSFAAIAPSGGGGSSPSPPSTSTAVNYVEVKNLPNETDAQAFKREQQAFREANPNLYPQKYAVTAAGLAAISSGVEAKLNAGRLEEMNAPKDKNIVNVPVSAGIAERMNPLAFAAQQKGFALSANQIAVATGAKEAMQMSKAMREDIAPAQKSYFVPVDTAAVRAEALRSNLNNPRDNWNKANATAMAPNAKPNVSANDISNNKEQSHLKSFLGRYEASSNELFTPREGAPEWVKFGLGAARGIASTAMLPVSFISSPKETAIGLYEGVIGTPKALYERPTETLGSIIGSSFVFGGASKSVGRIKFGETKVSIPSAEEVQYPKLTEGKAQLTLPEAKAEFIKEGGQIKYVTEAEMIEVGGGPVTMGRYVPAQAGKPETIYLRSDLPKNMKEYEISQFAGKTSYGRGAPVTEDTVLKHELTHSLSKIGTEETPISFYEYDRPTLIRGTPNLDNMMYAEYQPKIVVESGAGKGAQAAQDVALDYKGLYLQTGKNPAKAYPIIGVSKGGGYDIVIGTPKFKAGTYDTLLKGQSGVELATPFEKAIAEKNIISTYSAEEQALVKDLYAQRASTFGQKSKFVAEDLPIAEVAQTHGLKPETAKNINEWFGKQSIIADTSKFEMGGSVAAKAQTSGLPFRGIHDFDFYHKNPELAAKELSAIVEMTEGKGAVTVSGSTVSTPKAGTLFDIHNPEGLMNAPDEVAARLSTSKESYLAGAFDFEKPTKIGGKYAVPLSEQSSRKLNSLITLRKEGTLPPAKRIKDIADFFSHEKTLELSNGAESSRLAGIEQSYIRKISALEDTKDYGYGKTGAEIKETFFEGLKANRPGLVAPEEKLVLYSPKLKSAANEQYPLGRAIGISQPSRSEYSTRSPSIKSEYKILDTSTSVSRSASRSPSVSNIISISQSYGGSSASKLSSPSKSIFDAPSAPSSPPSRSPPKSPPSKIPTFYSPPSSPPSRRSPPSSPPSRSPPSRSPPYKPPAIFTPRTKPPVKPIRFRDKEFGEFSPTRKGRFGKPQTRYTPSATSSVFDISVSKKQAGKLKLGSREYSGFEIRPLISNEPKPRKGKGFDFFGV